LRAESTYDAPADLEDGIELRALQLDPVLELLASVVKLRALGRQRNDPTHEESADDRDDRGGGLDHPVPDSRDGRTNASDAITPQMP
jgi:hypothetical protein